ncbi:hypothetical protein BSNK01_31030 [Bacillaceae bacterium]
MVSGSAIDLRIFATLPETGVKRTILRDGKMAKKFSDKEKIFSKKSKEIQDEMRNEGWTNDGSPVDAAS